MGLSRVSKVCQACPYVDHCDRKRMEALGCLPLPTHTPKIEALIQQSQTISVNGISLDKLTDSLKPIINSMGYLKGENK